MRKNAGDLRPIFSLAALVTLAWTAPVNAQVATVSLDNIENRYGVASGPENSPVVQIGGSEVKAYAVTDVPGLLSEGGVNYTATASDTSFFFLHDNYCVGICSTSSQTTISFTITNNDSGALDLRFDSLITPGHIAQIFGDGQVSSRFDFSVTQTFSSEVFELYSAQGGVNSDGIFLNTSDERPFNNTEYSGVRGVYNLVDWSATNLNLNLFTLESGQSTTITYLATYESFGQVSCDDILNCAGAQVVFGDPRNNGGVTSFSSRGGLDAMVEPQPVIGADYDPFRITFDVRLQTDPLPGDPPAIIPPPYGPLFQPNVLGAVPEPATWAMLLAGVGAIGGTARRRRAFLRFA